MKILTIDLGETTGYAFASGIGRGTYELLAHGTVTMGEVPVFADAELVVIERPAYIGPGLQIQEEYSSAVAQFREVYGTAKVRVVRPADWMPRFIHFPLPGRGTLPSQHEKDAFRMAMWALEKFA